MAIDPERRRNSSQCWVITCKNGGFITRAMTKPDAEKVAVWCDQHHKDCCPHTVQKRGVVLRHTQDGVSFSYGL